MISYIDYIFCLRTLWLSISAHAGIIEKFMIYFEWKLWKLSTDTIFFYLSKDYRTSLLKMILFVIILIWIHVEMDIWHKLSISPVLKTKEILCEVLPSLHVFEVSADKTRCALSTNSMCWPKWVKVLYPPVWSICLTLTTPIWWYFYVLGVWG